MQFTALGGSPLSAIQQPVTSLMLKGNLTERKDKFCVQERRCNKYLSLLGINMKTLKISLDAARIIALTAMIGFVDGQRKIEDESFSRSRISLVKTSMHFVFDEALPGKPLDIKPDRTAYLVEIRRGDAIKEVLIDAVTGQVLLS